MSAQTRVFLTGSTGYVGSAVLDALLRAGLHVTALVREPAKAERLSNRGVEAVLGELGSPRSFVAAAAAADVLIHTAYERSKNGQQVDRQAIETLVEAANRRKARDLTTTLIYTSGVWVLGSTQGQATEEAPLRPTPLAAWRPDHERLVLDAGADEAIRAAVIRPAVVYGGGRGIVADLLKDAQNGLVRVVGDGQNRWSCVYDRDLADLYARVATNSEARGIFHANDEADERVIEIVEAIANHAKTRPDIRHMPLEEARVKMGAYADALSLDQIVRSPRARALGWTPTLHSVSGNVARLLEEFRAARDAA
jgi:nucleoside-diphosphate-sugar epimerase